jgi:hypothetical protein
MNYKTCGVFLLALLVLITCTTTSNASPSQVVTPDASQQYWVQNNSYDAAPDAWDNNSSTILRWNGTTEDNAAIHFNSPITINQIGIMGYTDGAWGGLKNFEVYGSNDATAIDNGTWNLLYTGVNPNDQFTHTFTFYNTVPYSSYKIHMIDGHLGIYKSVREIMLYDPSILPAGVTGPRIVPTIVGYSTAVPAHTGAGLFDGVHSTDWTNNQLFYWLTPTDYVEITITVPVNIYRSGTTPWTDYNTPLKILKKNVDGSYNDVSATHNVATPQIDETQWAKSVSNLRPGTYKLQKGISYTMDSEWFVEELPSTDVTAPAEITSLVENHTGNSATLNWTSPLDLDFNSTKTYRYNDTTGVWDLISS